MLSGVQLLHWTSLRMGSSSSSSYQPASDTQSSTSNRPQQRVAGFHSEHSPGPILYSLPPASARIWRVHLVASLLASPISAAQWSTGGNV
ncbi:hypothetical protein Y1Q_0022445 [Alligator mississippiensis]|uniref:Uncharacterized protein n=1 Tax=Alligator mississippiensis TaxID=8496 RepID=A0A151N0G7_ALLMI|nr:hypothetical protein Y1Q_0022445 [Alligator mississippiensis]